MPRAPRFWGPRAYSLLFPPEFFVPCFSAGPKQCASVGPQRAQVPQKTRGPKKAGPQTFCSLFQCFSVGPQRAQGPPENARPQNLKIEAPKSGAPNGILFPVLAWVPNSAGPQRVQGPQRRTLGELLHPPQKKPARSQSLKSRGSKSRATNKIFCSFFGSEISKFAVNCSILKDC